MLTIEEVLSQSNQNRAFEHLKTKRDGHGPDGMWLSELEEYWKINGDDICENIIKSSYQPGVVQIKEHLNKRGKKRSISCINSIDRFILRLLAQKLRQYIEPQFLSHSYAYQEGKGLIDAIAQIKKFLEKGDDYIAEIDIKNYFETISLPLLIEKLNTYIDDECIMSLIQKYLYCSVLRDGRIFQKTKGILTGSAISPILSNIYMNDFDCYMKESKCQWIRFADNIYLFSDTFDRAIQLYNQMSVFLIDQFKLEINQSKSGVYQAGERIILGYDIIRNGKKVDLRKHVFREQKCYHVWNKSQIELLDGRYHIVSDGIINREDYSVLFENEEKKIIIPVEVTDQINIYSNVTLAANVLCQMSNKRIKVAFFDRYGRLSGCFIPEKFRGTGNVLLKQCEVYLNGRRRLDIARRMEIASLHNIRSNLKYYEKHEKGVYIDAIRRISELITTENTVTTVNQLMLVEAQARQIYYQMFEHIIKEKDFRFFIRTKHPPEDAINACISFGNALLYNDFLNIILTKGLNPAIGMVHSTNRRNYSLNLDFADIFKPIITDRVIFSLLNRRMLGIRHFEQHGEGIFLSKTGKAIFLEAYEKKMKETLVIKGVRYTYRNLMRLEVQNFKNEIINGKKYKPYKYY